MSNEINHQLINDPEALFIELTGCEPFEYQANYLVSTAKKICFRAARQIGKTESTSIKAIHHAITIPKAVVLCLAPTIRQSGQIFRKIRLGFRDTILRDMIVSESQTRIELSNGSEIICLPGDSPKNIMGFSPTMLIIDEAAWVKEEVYAAILPSLSFTKGTLILISTPAGKTGRFYQSFSNDSFEQYHVRAIDCPVNTQEELDKERDIITEMEYKQMYEGEFVEQLDAFFPDSLVNSCVFECTELTEAPKTAGFNYYLGVDCARYGLDETVYTVVQKSPIGELEVVKIVSTSKKPITDIIGRVKELNGKFNFAGIFVDESGLGAGAVDVLKESNVILRDLNGEKKGIPFTLINKEIMFKNLKLLMEQGQLKIPQHSKLISQMKALQYEYTQSHLKIHHPEEPNAHDDYPDSLALACLCGLDKGPMRHYIAG